MRYFSVLRADAESEAGTPPSPELIEKMGKLVEEFSSAGVLVATDGLLPSSKGARVQFTDGQMTVTDGPIADMKEIVCAYAVYDVSSKEEAIEWTKKFLDVLGTGTCDVYEMGG